MCTYQIRLIEEVTDALLHISEESIRIAQDIQTHDEDICLLDTLGYIMTFDVLKKLVRGQQGVGSLKEGESGVRKSKVFFRSNGTSCMME